MKKVFFLIVILFGCIDLFAQDFTVKNYSVEVYINKDGYFDVVEKYHLNFEFPKHGIYRDIKVCYDLENQDGSIEKREIQIGEIEVPGYKFEKSSKFEQRMSCNAQIKIGDADITLVGDQDYEIRYRVYNAFLHEESQDQFYWNIKPNNWNADFQKIHFQIHLPEGVNISPDKVFIYSGLVGNSTPSSDFDSSLNGQVFSASSNDGVISSGGEAVTVLIKMPPGSIKEIKPFWPFWSDYGWTIILGLIIFGFIRIWVLHGKDDHVSTTTSYYPPQGMDPAMAGYLIDDSGDTSDLISLIPFWATQGYLKIEEIDKKGWFAKDDTKLIKLNSLPPGTPSYQRKIFDGLFTKYGDSQEVLISSLKEKFYTTMNASKSSLKDAAQIYYVNESRKIRNYTIGGLIFLLIILSPIALYFWGILAVVSTVVTLIFLLIMSQFLIKKNSKGNLALSELKGFKNFIKIAEENKLKMLLKEDPTYFESTMSYALAFGMFDKWSRKFDALNIPPPTWYTSNTGRMMNMNHFSQSFSSSINSARSTMVSSPSSSGS